MKNICLIIHSLGIGGMESVIYQLIQNFAAREDIIVNLILIGKKREVVYSLPTSVNVYKPPFPFSDAKRTIDTMKTIRFLRKKVKEINPDRILSFGEYWNNLVLLSLYGLSFPVFISDRSEPGKDLGKVQNLLRKLLYPGAAGYIAQTKEAKNICLSNEWNKQVKVIGNPIRRIHSNGQVKKENIVLSVGRLIKTKHFDQLIRLFVEIGNPDWKLVIVGGDSKKLNLSIELKKLVQELGAEDFIFLEGQQEEIDIYYKKSSVFAFTSSSEGFPNVIGEALSAGLPVVCYDGIAGPSDMIENGVNGYLIPANDENLFKNKLSLLMTDKNIRKSLSEQCKSSIKRFNVDIISSQYFSFMFNK